MKKGFSLKRNVCQLLVCIVACALWGCELFEPEVGTTAYYRAMMEKTGGVVFYKDDTCKPAEGYVWYDNAGTEVRTAEHAALAHGGIKPAPDWDYNYSFLERVEHSSPHYGDISVHRMTASEIDQKNRAHEEQVAQQKQYEHDHPVDVQVAPDRYHLLCNNTDKKVVITFKLTLIVDAQESYYQHQLILEPKEQLACYQSGVTNGFFGIDIIRWRTLAEGESAGTY